MARGSPNSGQVENNLLSIVNQGYFSDYFLAYRLDAGLADLYKRWDALERNGDPTSRTQMRGLGRSFDAFRIDAALTSPDALGDNARLDLKMLPAEGVAAERSLNDAILRALGWEPDRSEVVILTSGDKVILVPVALRCQTSSGLLLVAIETVFATDPTTVLASKVAPAGTLLEPIIVGEKPEGRSVIEAAQLIFTADEPPNYVLVCSGGSVILLDRDRWGEGVYLAANIDDAVARNDVRARGELAAIAALFGAEAINPGDDAQSYLAGLLERAANESAGVSKELRHGVRRSVELLANAVVRDVRYRQKGAWTEIDPEQLTRECLRYLYRIIVLLFAEARPELGILPVDDTDYQAGYSLARLRDVALTDLHGDQALNSSHIQQSLALLFRVVNTGYEPETVLEIDSSGLSFPGLGSTLFSDPACPMLDRARITDETLQQVLSNLCFTREQKGRSRQSLSYAALGINQLGAVYEGLMAYKGFLSKDELYEIDNDGDPDNGSWVIPIDQADEYPDSVFLKETGSDGHERRVVYHEGDFVFRLSGRDRQRSASYYTPEVMTEFTVRHTIDVYWEEHPGITAEEILRLTICEPALGSGAFLDETVNQVAARYLKARQDELSETIDPDQYQLELQKAKAHFAINQSYGVDLNPTAVELAEVSLWLNCMHPGLKAPNFDARLRRGNSLIGARRATYTPDQVKAQPWKASSAKQAVPPTDQPLHEAPFGEVAGIHHFLIPGEGWGAAAEVTDLKGKGGKNPTPGLAGEWSEFVRAWRSSIQSVPTKAQIDRLSALARRVESAWAAAAAAAASHLRMHSRAVGVWKADETKWSTSGTASSVPFLDPEGPVARLRLLMDAWCALWMWSPANGTVLPTMNEWIEAAELLLGQPTAIETGEFFTSYDLADGTLDSVERFGKASVDEVIERFDWLKQCQVISQRQAFFHWELEQAGVFTSGGFDIQVGNPPWLRPRWDEPASLAEFDPWWGVTELKETKDTVMRERRSQVLLDATASAAVANDRAEIEGIGALLSAGSREPFLRGIQTNLYMVFMTNTWRRSRSEGVVGLLHPESHFVDPKAGPLRAQTYRRLRQHWQFSNEMKLFGDVHNETEFGVNVYGDARSPSFLQAVNLLSPSTADRSLGHDGEGDLPGIQFPEGGWDLRPHATRIVTVDEEVLASWVLLFDEPGTTADESRLLRPLTTADLEALSTFARLPTRLGSTTRCWSRGFDEDKLKSEGTGVWRTEFPASLEDCILQGPHILNATPFAQQPRPNCKSNKDWEAIDLETIPTDFVPRTNYQRLVGAVEFVRRQADWDGEPYSKQFREAHREFVGAGSVRTLQACILPPGPVHVNSVISIAREDNRSTTRWASTLMSLPYDYLIKALGNGHVNANVTDSLPIPPNNTNLDEALLVRSLRLNCVTSSYAPLWEELFDKAWSKDRFVAQVDTGVELGDVSPSWTWATPLRGDYERWLATCEIDAIVALLLGLSEEQLFQMYRSQFAVLRKYENATVFDGNGGQIAADFHAHGFVQVQWEADLKSGPTKRGEKRIGMWDRVQAYLDGKTSVDLGPFVPPFRPANREVAMSRAYRAFTDRIEADA
jgi:hypothetical protein